MIDAKATLVERVAAVIGCDDDPVNWKPEARAALREVEKWLREEKFMYFAALLKDELEA